MIISHFIRPMAQIWLVLLIETTLVSYWPLCVHICREPHANQSRPVVLNQTDFAFSPLPPMIFGNVWRHFLLSQLVGGGGAIDCALKPGILLNILHCTGHTPPPPQTTRTKSIWPEMSVVPRLGISPYTRGIFKRSEDTYKVISGSLVCCPGVEVYAIKGSKLSVHHEVQDCFLPVSKMTLAGALVSWLPSK